MSDDDYRETMDVNVKGVFEGARVAAEEMLERDGGSIVNLSSINGDRGTGGDVIYCTSKGAVKTMTYALADALGPEIRVNAIHPGSIETAQTLEDYDALEPDQREKRIETIPLSRIGRPDDVANVALFLASDLADYVTAESVVVDGGMINTR
jgi:NAD(P)-dependent dehydrogenase (short-subunit alcohol dehydrogenase family)